MSETFTDLKVGDRVIRMFGGTPMTMVVSAVKDQTLICDAVEEDGSIFVGGWEFDRKTGAEEDEYLGWGVKHGVTGSYLTKLTEVAKPNG